MKEYIASVRRKGTREITLIRSEYPNKKQFANDLRCNGYTVRFITTEENFDRDCEKWNEAREYQNEVNRKVRSY